MGLTSIKDRNISLLAKWWWRAYSERGTFWNNLFSSCYGPEWNFNLSNLPSNRCSPIVRSFLSIKSVSRCSFVTDNSNFRWICGNGIRIFFWEDVWLTNTNLASRFSQLYAKFSQPHGTVVNLLEKFKTNPMSESL